MRVVPIIAMMFLGIAAAQGQTMSQTNGQASSSGSAAGSDPLAVATSSSLTYTHHRAHETELHLV
jgi:uncharacterized spore protein YtfJ